MTLPGRCPWHQPNCHPHQPLQSSPFWGQAGRRPKLRSEFWTTSRRMCRPDILRARRRLPHRLERLGIQVVDTGPQASSLSQARNRTPGADEGQSHQAGDGALSVCPHPGSAPAASCAQVLIDTLNSVDGQLASLTSTHTHAHTHHVDSQQASWISAKLFPKHSCWRFLASPCQCAVINTHTAANASSDHTGSLRKGQENDFSL